MIHTYDLANIHLIKPSVVTIGVFDGMHRGHQHLIRRLVTEAHDHNQLAVVMTFHPHPDVVLRDITGRYYLTTPEQRATFMFDLGVDCVVTHPFNEAVRQIRAADFVDQLVRHLKMERLWVGDDFALGYKREGNVAFLREQGTHKGFTVDVIDMVHTDDARVSSTLIREALTEGRIEDVREWLGWSYALSGEVIHGKKRGRTIGFPTANIAVPEDLVIPANGVYASWVYLNGEKHMAMTNVGVSPTFGNDEVTVEAYILDFDRDIYGQTLTITFEKYLRPEAKYNSLQELIDQIHRDVAFGREYLASLQTDRLASGG
ncbi:MAG: bifunctional riboflavin kinase/FAD synthetase [Anaerolineae bacterium]